MKKALTIYIDDDCTLKQYNATFVVIRHDGANSVTMQNTALGKNNALFLPFFDHSNNVSLFVESDKRESDSGNADFYVRDKRTGTIHRVGDDQHDSIWVDEDGLLHYMNLQNGDGCSGASRNNEKCGYEFVQSDCGALGR